MISKHTKSMFEKHLGNVRPAIPCHGKSYKVRTRHNYIGYRRFVECHFAERHFAEFYFTE